MKIGKIWQDAVLCVMPKGRVDLAAEDGLAEEIFRLPGLFRTFQVR